MRVRACVRACVRARARADLHVVEGDADAVGEVGAEEGDLGVALAEVVQHDELSVHLHPHGDGLGGRAGGRGIPILFIYLIVVNTLI